MNFHFLKMKYPLLILLVALASCKTSRPITNPEPAARLLPEVPTSQINIPVKIYMKSLLTVMDSTTSKEFTNEQWPDYTESSCDFRYKYRFLRSPFTFSCVNNNVVIGFRGSYQIAGSKRVCGFDKPVSPWVGGSCGFGTEPLRKVDISIRSLLEFAPNHQLRTTTRLEASKAIDKCSVTILQTDITPQIMDSITASVNSYCTVFDQFVQAINNNSLLTNWRAGGSRVMPVSSYGFLNLNPILWRIGRFNTNKDTLLFSVGFSGTPQFSSDSLRLVKKSPLPPLSTTAPTGGISTYLNTIYDYTFFNKLLNDSLRNKPFEVEGRTFVIKDVKIGGTNEGKISVDVAFTGNRSGVLHLSGTPKLDSINQVISMPDINFSIDTKDMLVNIGKALFRKKIIKELKNQSVLDLAALIQKNRAQIEARFNQPLNEWMSTQGKLYDIKLIGLLPQKEYVQVQAFIKADLSLVASPPASLLKGF